MHGTHSLFRVRMVVTCSRCGCWMYGHPKGLLQPCGAAVSDARRADLGRMLNGLYPLRNKPWPDGAPGDIRFPVRRIHSPGCISFNTSLHRWVYKTIYKTIKRNNATRKNVCVTQHQPENIRSIGCFGLTIRVPEAAAVRTQRVETTIDPQNLPISDPPDQQKRERRVACMYVYM